MIQSATSPGAPNTARLFFPNTLRGYAIADASFADRIAFRIVCLPLIQIAYGVETGQAEDIDQGIVWLRRDIDQSVKPDSQ